MNAYTQWLNKLLNDNQKKFNDLGPVKWLNPYHADVFQEQRDNLLDSLGNSSLFEQTKPFYKQISHGCKLCGTGTWSCLFITEKCNAACFYCPTSQCADEIPATQSLHFADAKAYADYINYFDFKGVSLSGGEPLLFFDKSLHYLKTIRKRCKPSLYTWLYTNGILADAKNLKKLAATGLDEIRFDIGARAYKLDKVCLAKNIISNITIEIPAVPEEAEKIKSLLPEIIKSGVTNLNLHQLRLTRHNATHLLKRNYTYIPAEQPIVLESELAALDIINHARKHSMNIGINYCSFFFKNRYQSAGFRKQVVNKLALPDDQITKKGFIREYHNNQLAYKSFRLSDTVSAQSKLLLLPHKNIYFETQYNLSPVLISPDYRARVEKLIEEAPGEMPEDALLFKIWQMEHVEKGLRRY
jgi:pyruvate formate-lyase activating enzyme-like uncharacterized protein